MVEQHTHLDAVFHALADPTRRAMLGHLADRELTIGELATPFSMSFAGASKHVRVLENAGLVSRLEGLCRPLRQTVLISGAVAAETTATLVPSGTSVAVVYTVPDT